jgi:hypothetical protein
MNFRNLATATLAIAVDAHVHASESLPVEVELLSGATIFKLGLIGMAPHLSDEEVALATLLKRPDAQAQLSTLLSSARSNEGRLYALCGLRQLSKSSYERSLRGIKWDGDGFNLMHADVITKASVKQQVQRMRREGCTVRQQ